MKYCAISANCVIFVKQLQVMKANIQKTSKIVNRLQDRKTKNGVEYDYYSDMAEYYKDGYVVATLNFSADNFEQHEDMTEDEADTYYNEMTAERNDIINDDYDVTAEQGLYGCGY